ncbi:hypothetical protein A1D31_14105 [Bradyrhizobium liaoningense]|nr:hypothetical protein A1D31_14105 [Bradyrhizobium liaoningense]
MTVTASLARDEAITDALRVANDAIGDEQPTAQALKIIAAIKRLRAADPVKIAALSRVNYLAQLQREAQAKWVIEHDKVPLAQLGPEHDTTAGVDTPLGRFRMVTWRRTWRTGRIAWASEYYLNDQPITIAEIEAAGLAQRPTTRQRRRA